MVTLIRAWRRVKRIVLSIIIAAPLCLIFGITVFLFGLYDAVRRKPINTK